MTGGGRSRRRRFDDPHADEAAQFLDRDVGASDVAPMIRGMDRIARVRAWRAVERNLGRGVDNGPRSGVLSLLDDREATLEEIGERPDRLPHGPLQSHAERAAGAPPKTAAEARAEQEETVATASDDDVVADAFATDGGEQS